MRTELRVAGWSVENKLMRLSLVNHMVEIEEEKNQLVVKPISEKEAMKLGW
jgi:hypothetical protein